jgi:N6-L-threonylcarbamoyladenine synthase
LVNDVCYAFQEAVLDVLVEKAFRAAHLKRCERIVLGGGVAINSRLRERFLEASRLSGGVKVYFPEKKYCLDNAAMVGGLGERLYKMGYRSDLRLAPEPNLKIGETFHA